MNGVPFATVSETGRLAFRRGATGQLRQLSWYDRAGKVLEAIAKPGEYRSLALSPDGKRVAFERGPLTSSDNRVHDFARGSTARLTFDKAAESLPVCSPDGERVSYYSRRDKPPTVFQKPASGAGEEQPFLKSTVIAVPADFSPNGRAFFYVVGEGIRRRDLWVSPLEDSDAGAPEGKPFLNTEFSETQGVFSPDSRFIAYTSNASGRVEVYVRPYSTDGKTSGQWMISTNGGAQPRWSSDGKELFYISGDSKLMAVPVSTAGVFRPGLPAALFLSPVIASPLTRNWDVAPGGRKFLFAASAGENRFEPIVVVQNWQAELRAK